MSFLKECQDCGKKVSLRKMPHGGWVAFNPKSKKVHKCKKQNTKVLKKAKQDSNYRGLYSQAELIVKIRDIINKGNGVKAIEVARRLGIIRKDVNSILYGKLKNEFYRGLFYKWYKKSDVTIAAKKSKNVRSAKLEEVDIVRNKVPLETQRYGVLTWALVFIIILLIAYLFYQN